MNQYPASIAMEQPEIAEAQVFAPEGMPPILWRSMAVFFGLALFMAVLSPLAVLVHLGLTIYALRGARQTVEALTLFTLILLGNRAIFSGSVEVFRWVFLFACFGRVIWDTVFPQNDAGNLARPLTYGMGIFFLTALILAIVASKMPVLSVFKLISYTVGVVTIFISMYRTRHLHEYWQAWLTTFFVFIVVASGLAFVTGFGNVRAASLFQGIWAHPQILGPASAIMVAWFAGQLFFKERIGALLVLTIGSLALVYFSGARTGGFAFVFGFIITFLLWRVFMKRRLPLGNMMTGGVMLLVLFVAVPVLVLQGPSLTTAVTDYILKDDFDEQLEAGAPGAADVFAESRGARMNASLNNFMSNPVTGIGFGVPTTYEEYRRMQTGVMGIPVGASYEKGFMPSAIVEEMGVLGTLTVIFMFLAFAVPVVRYAPFHVVWVFWTALAMNVGAAVYFSIGGVGMLMWLMVGFAYNQACGIMEELEVGSELA